MPRRRLAKDWVLDCTGIGECGKPGNEEGAHARRFLLVLHMAHVRAPFACRANTHLGAEERDFPFEQTAQRCMAGANLRTKRVSSRSSVPGAAPVGRCELLMKEEGADARNGRATANVLLAGAMGCCVRDRTGYRSNGLPREICHQTGMLTGRPGRWDRMGRKWRCTEGAAAKDGSVWRRVVVV